MNRATVWTLAVLGVAVVGVGGGYLGYRSLRGAPEPAVSSQAPTPVPAPAGPVPATSAEPAIRNPITPPADAATDLPSLAMSDSSMRAAIVGLIGERAFASWLVPENIIRRVVVTVDNLPRAKMSAQNLPVRSVPGSFVTERGAGDDRTIGSGNAARYAPYVELVRKIDVQQLVQLYVRNYPLFQQAYVDLGYPHGYFNDRLIDAIDNLLAAPEVSGPIHLVQPEVMYRFADADLESLPVGQKILVRMGRDNAAVVKTKLKELRAALVQATLPRPSAY